MVVSWLPLYHDMGLIGSWLGALFCGGSGFYLSPVSFIRDPALWVRLISKHRGTHMQVRSHANKIRRKKLNSSKGRNEPRKKKRPLISFIFSAHISLSTVLLQHNFFPSSLTHHQAPNFAYALTARKFLATPKRSRQVGAGGVLDLSCVRHMINAAEPVRLADIEAFYAAFEHYGLPRVRQSTTTQLGS